MCPFLRSLENFRKQAKLLVRWHRERNYSVGGRIRQLSRYAVPVLFVSDVQQAADFY